jgi:hypothetical protein
VISSSVLFHTLRDLLWPSLPFPSTRTAQLILLQTSSAIPPLLLLILSTPLSCFQSNSTLSTTSITSFSLTSTALTSHLHCQNLLTEMHHCLSSHLILSLYAHLTHWPHHGTMQTLKAISTSLALSSTYLHKYIIIIYFYISLSLHVVISLFCFLLHCCYTCGLSD